MLHRFRTHLIITSLIFTVILVCSMKSVVSDNSAEEIEPTAKAERLKLATEHIRGMEFRCVSGSKEEQVEVIDHPLLTYGDAARLNENGTLWAWGRRGRPLAIMEVYQGQNDNRRWVHAVTLTSADLIVATGQPGWRWTPKQPAISPQPVPKIETLAAKESLRLRQMKEIAGRFTAHEYWDPNNSRFELRLLVQPVHRYAQPSAKLHDGAVFVFAHGTNPEILLLIEALGESPETSQWNFSAARLGSAELHLLLDSQEVWKQPRTPGVVGLPTDPYWLFITQAVSPASSRN